MKVIGLTGGIGSGKSTVAAIFESFGIPVFNSDQRAKNLYENPAVVKHVKARFGPQVMDGEVINFKKLAGVVFHNEEDLKWLNELIHPKVQDSFEKWMQEQSTNLVIKESAILIETGGHLRCDKVVLVEANQENRITRVMQRDHISRAAVLARMNKQATDVQRIKAADFSISNNGEALLPQVTRLIKQLQMG